MLIGGGSETSLYVWGTGVIDARIRNEGRPDKGGIERSRLRLREFMDESIEVSRFMGMGIEANAEDREIGRDGGSIDIVRERVLARMKLELLCGKS